MSDSSVSVTSVSLLERVKNPADQAAWTDFVYRYGPKVYGWAKRLGLQPSDAEDIVQDVLTKLLHSLKTFDYRTGKFRAWLRRVTGTTLLDYVCRRKRHGQGSGNAESFDRLASLPAREDLCERLRREFDGELLQIAMGMARDAVEPQTWEVFRLRSDESLPYKQIALRLDINVGAAKVAYGRVLARVRDNLKRLDDPDDQESEA